jgi:hypothetical protein
MTLYVVAGYPRTGTSLMVHAAHAGDIRAVIGDSRRPNVRRGHQSQPDSYWQPPRDWWRSNKAQLVDGRVVKFLLHADGLTLPPRDTGDYQVAVMIRDEREVRASLMAAYGTKSSYTEERAVRWAKNLSVRDDVSAVTVVDHRALILRPRTTLERLGWPLDVDASAMVVDPDWWRFRVM